MQHDDATIDALVQRLEFVSEEFAEIGSPFVSRLLALMAEDVRSRPSGGTAQLLLPTLDAPVDDYHAQRALSGVHWRVLNGDEPPLTAHYGSVGGDNDPDAAWPIVRAVLDRQPDEVVKALAHPLQTNEPARSAALIVGLLEIAAITSLPIRLLEVGASAGLNLHLDKFRFEHGETATGPADSPVRFVDLWPAGAPRFDTTLRITHRRGCDRDPIDLRSADEHTRLLSYVWPDEKERFALHRGATQIAATDPVAIDSSDAADWVEQQLDGPLPAGEATVVMHSLVWMYLDTDTQRRIDSAMRRAGERAADNAPLAWLRFEQEASHKAACDLRLQMWPGGDDVLLATGGHHLAPVHVY
ncbi:MAG: DUF2332 domain-containing protein [Actinomycetota bacterium]